MNKSLSKLTKISDTNKYDIKYEEMSAGMMALLNLNDPKWKIDKRRNSPLIDKHEIEPFASNREQTKKRSWGRSHHPWDEK